MKRRSFFGCAVGAVCGLVGLKAGRAKAEPWPRSFPWMYFGRLAGPLEQGKKQWVVVGRGLCLGGYVNGRMQKEVYHPHERYLILKPPIDGGWGDYEGSWKGRIVTLGFVDNQWQIIGAEGYRLPEKGCRPCSPPGYFGRLRGPLEPGKPQTMSVHADLTPERCSWWPRGWINRAYHGWPPQYTGWLKVHSPLRGSLCQGTGFPEGAWVQVEHVGGQWLVIAAEWEIDKRLTPCMGWARCLDAIEGDVIEWAVERTVMRYMFDVKTRMGKCWMARV